MLDDIEYLKWMVKENVYATIYMIVAYSPLVALNLFI